MPSLAAFHPQVVHFVIAFLAAGVVLRLAWLLRWKQEFFDPAARLLIVTGALLSVVAVKSGTDAHGPAERVPGARDAVVDHEEWGERTRNLFLVVAALELGALGMGARPGRRWLTTASALAGLAGLWALYETGAHGGELVYSYAGGVGLRSGDPTDVSRLLLAGLYHQAQLDRREQRLEESARLIEEMERRFPENRDVQFLAVESLILDRKDGRRALERLAAIPVPLDTPRVRLRHALLLADAYLAAGHPDSARAALAELARLFPADQRIMQRLQRLK
jgi:uncharacterized membrane protein